VLEWEVDQYQEHMNRVKGVYCPVGRGHVIEKYVLQKRSQNMFNLYLPA